MQLATVCACQVPKLVQHISKGKKAQYPRFMHYVNSMTFLFFFCLGLQFTANHFDLGCTGLLCNEFRHFC